MLVKQNNHNHHTFFDMDNMNEAFGRIGLIMTGIFGSATLIQPQVLTLIITAMTGIPTGLYYAIRFLNERKKGKILDEEFRQLLEKSRELTTKQ